MDQVQSRPYQSYTILTMCRTMYTLKFGEQVSKPKAAAWAADELPQWAALIRNALAWREIAVKGSDAPVDDAATLEDMRAFVRFVFEREAQVV